MYAILQFSDVDAPGCIAHVLREELRPFDVVHVHRGQPVPCVEELSGLVLLGSPLSVNAAAPWMRSVVSVVEACLTRGVPTIGHCFGAQLIAKVLGSTVASCPEPEVGWADVESVPRQDADRAWPAEFVALQWHFEGFSLPSGAAPLWRSAAWENQGFTYGSHIAMQFHIEATAREVQTWCERNMALFHPRRPGVQPLERLRAQAPSALRSQSTTAREIYRHWLGGHRDWPTPQPHEGGFEPVAANACRPIPELKLVEPCDELNGSRTLLARPSTSGGTAHRP